MTGSEDGGGSFEDRLQAARRRQGLGPRPSKIPGGTAPEVNSALGIGLRVGVELVSAVAVAVAIGWWLDKWLHTSPVLLLVFVLLGWAAGVLNVWRSWGADGRRIGDRRAEVRQGGGGQSDAEPGDDRRN
jgi:ATP synthase protein I